MMRISETGHWPLFEVAVHVQDEVDGAHGVEMHGQVPFADGDDGVVGANVSRLEVDGAGAGRRRGAGIEAQVARRGGTYHRHVDRQGARRGGDAAVAAEGREDAVAAAASAATSQRIPAIRFIRSLLGSSSGPLDTEFPIRRRRRRGRAGE